MQYTNEFRFDSLREKEKNPKSAMLAKDLKTISKQFKAIKTTN